MKKFILCVMTIFLVLGGHTTSRAEETAKPENNNLVADRVEVRDSKSKDALIEQIQKDVIPDSNALYVDLAREIGRTDKQKEINQNATIIADKMKALQDELTNKMKELETIQKSADLKIKAGEEGNDNLKLVVNLYESIGADQAAELLKHMPMTVTIKMIQMMAPKKAAKILAAMDSKFASELSRRLIRNPAVASASPTTTTPGEK